MAFKSPYKNYPKGFSLGLSWDQTDDLAVNTAKILAADAVEEAGSGHPGTAMSMAPAAYLLFQKVLRHNPANPKWPGRDRFILSCGHASLLLYIQLFYAGYGLELEDIQGLRTWGSLTPGHPEYGHTPGVEMTTGPLGQGLASSVGFAYSQRYERGLFDPETPPGQSPFDHHVYAFASEGDLEEGITSEASSLAGLQGLGNLIVIFDRNQISIEGNTDVAFTENIKARYEAYGWQVLEVSWRRSDGYREDPKALYEAIIEAKVETNRPSLVILHTVIGWPSPHKQNTGSIHGAKLGEPELGDLKKVLGFDPGRRFVVDAEILPHTRKALDRGRRAEFDWQRQMETWRAKDPGRTQLYDRLSSGKAPDNLEEILPVFEAGQSISTRAAGGKVINALAKVMPELWGGSADLAESNDTAIVGANSFLPKKIDVRLWPSNPYGRVLHFGIREHAMAAMVNGVALHGLTRPFGATFFVFSDYMRPAVRLAALMNIPSVFVWTHDSIGLGEDGPTHQPVEHLWAMRAIPNLSIVRPADANETAWAWKRIVEHRSGPCGLVLSRQNLPVLDRNKLAGAHLTEKGAYILAEASGSKPGVILIATGSEVAIAAGARRQLEDEGIPTRLVSAPCLEWFEEQTEDYKASVLPEEVTARVSVEAGLALGWVKYVGDRGRSVSVEKFGASASGAVMFEKYEITQSAVARAAKAAIAAQ